MNITIEDKINIDEIVNLVKYAHVASLVDNPIFLERVKSIRSSIELSKLLPYNEVKKWLTKKPKKNSLIQMNEKDKNHFRNKNRFEIQVNGLLEELHRDDTYANIVKYAVLAGKVTDKECATKTAYCVTYPPPDDLEFAAEKPMVAILITPETKPKEIEHLFKTEAKQLFKEIDATRKILVKPKSFVKRDRNWYWDNLLVLGKGSTFLANEYNGITKQGVNDAIEDYKKLINANSKPIQPL